MRESHVPLSPDVNCERIQEWDMGISVAYAVVTHYVGLTITCNSHNFSLTESYTNIYEYTNINFLGKVVEIVILKSLLLSDSFYNPTVVASK